LEDGHGEVEAPQEEEAHHNNRMNVMEEEVGTKKVFHRIRAGLGVLCGKKPWRVLRTVTRNVVVRRERVRRTEADRRTDEEAERSLQALKQTIHFVLP